MLEQPSWGTRSQTAALVKEELQKLNLPIREGLALTGVEARWPARRRARVW